MTPPNPDRYVRWLDEIGLTELPEAGGKNASLGELTRALVPRGVRVPEGFALTTQAYRDFLAQSRLEQKIDETLAGEFHRRTGLAGRSCPDGLKTPRRDRRGLAGPGRRVARELLKGCHGTQRGWI